MPKEAQRAWILGKERVLRPHPDGGVQLRFLSFVDRVDIGHYKPSVGEMCYGFAIATANELGDHETRDGLIERWEALQPSVVTDGARRYPCSTVSNLMLMIGRFGGERTFYDLVNNGAPDAVRRGPRLEEAPYPDALVASATNDGRALHLVLRPGGTGGRVRLGVGRLDPGGVYGMVGGVEQQVVADHEGRAVVHADLAGRTPLRIEPGEEW
jgi:hypothetical protein